MVAIGGELLRGVAPRALFAAGRRFDGSAGAARAGFGHRTGHARGSPASARVSA